MEQLRHVLDLTPTATEAERRDQAVFALIMLTGIRDNAAASLRIKHVDLERMLILQDPWRTLPERRPPMSRTSAGSMAWAPPPVASAMLASPTAWHRRWLTREQDIRAAEKVPYRLLEECPSFQPEIKKPGTY